MPEQFKVPEIVFGTCALTVSYPAYMAYVWAQLIAARVRLADHPDNVLWVSTTQQGPGTTGRVVVSLDTSDAGKDPWHGSIHTVVVGYQDHGIVRVSMRAVVQEGVLMFRPIRIEYKDYLSLSDDGGSDIFMKNLGLEMCTAVIEEKEALRVLLAHLQPFTSERMNRPLPLSPAVRS